TIMGGVPGYTYAWSNGATTEDITGVPAGDYFISVTDANGCVTPPNIPISVGQPDSLAVTLDQITDNQCADDSTGAIDITVSGGTMPYSFLWDNGATTEDLTGLPNGSYTGTITDANGCELVSPALAVANTDSLPEGSFAYMPVGGVNYNVDFSSSSPNATSYAWDFGDSNTSTDPNPSHSYATNNDYVVSLTITNDCGSVTITDTVSVTQVGIEDNLLSQNVKIYPNPNQGIFEVNFDRLDLEDVTIQVYSMEGRRVYSQEIGTIRGLYSHQVNLPENIAKGVYMLHINTAKANLRKRFLLN
ncbi:MAG: T9SS type A sorting domain-containing protein, partial [Bacteroidetes bacterium]|nr:T9SS type A sorting domain-containing protein [Bacteroidota bacterium]